MPGSKRVDETENAAREQVRSQSHETHSLALIACTGEQLIRVPFPGLWPS